MSQGNGRLPAGWVKVEIVQVLAPQENGQAIRQGWSPQCLKEVSPNNETWGVLKTTAIQDGEFLPEHNKELPDKLEPRPELEVNRGDLLLTCAGPRARCGVACLVRETRPRLMISGKMYRMRVDSRCALSDFVETFLRAPETQQLIDEMKTGISDSGLNLTQSRFSQLEIPLPPLPEQRRIVARIEELQARTRRTRKALESVPELLEQFRQSVLASAFRGDLTAVWRERHPDVEPASVLLERIRAERRQRWEEAGLAKLRAKGKEPKDDRWKQKYEEPEPVDAEGLPELPEGWAWAQLESIVDAERGVPYGIVQTGQEHPGGIPTVRGGDISGFSIDSAHLKRVALSIEEQYARTRLKGGEVLIAIRGTVGATAAASPDMAGINISREVAMIPVLSAIIPHFLMYALSSPEVANRVLGRVKGVAQAGINLSDLRELMVPVAPLCEQTEIVERVQTALHRAQVIGEITEETSAAADRVDNSVLNKAFRGELVPQDPNDAPASVLLERIRNERDQQPRRGRRRGSRG